jgi:hypothetical protein
MTEGEVKSLQDIAKAHGGSLTINPQTGLPEAGFLSSILPVVAGAGLMMIPGMQPLGAAALVGGGCMLLYPRQSLTQGLLTGLSAYGGASLGQSLAMEGVKSSAAGAATAAAPTTAASTVDFVPVNDGLTMFSQRAVSAPSYVSDGLSSFNQLPQAAPINIAPVTTVTPAPASLLGTPTGMTNDMARDVFSNLGPMERASAMGEGFTGKNLTNYAMENPMRTAGMVTGPLLASEKQPGVPTVPVDRDPGQQYDYYPGIALPTPSADPYGREKTYYSGSYRPRTAANGGMMGWPAGESVIKMADGGVPRYFGGGAVIFDLLQT